MDPGARRWWTLAALAVAVRFLIMPYGGFPTDIATFKAWAAMLAERGPGAFYGTGFADYLPGYLYVLWLIGEVHQVVRFSDQAFLFALKLPAAIADVAMAWVIFAFARSLGSRWALALSASYLFNPGIVFTGALWGQADAVGAAFALAGVTALAAAAPIPAAVLLTLGALVKPQTAPALVPAGIFLIRILMRPPTGPPRWDLLLGTLGAGIATAAAVIVPFGLSGTGLIGLARTSLNVYPYSSVMAFNAWGALQGFWVSDGGRWMGLSPLAWGTAAAAVALGAVAVWTWRHATPRGLVVAVAAALLATFVLPTRVHERYLLSSVAFLAGAVAVDRRLAWIYGGASAVFALNLIYAYTRPHLKTFVLPGWIEGTVFAAGTTRAWSAAMVLMLLAAAYLLATWRSRHGPEPPDPEPEPSQLDEGARQHAEVASGGPAGPAGKVPDG